MEIIQHNNRVVALIFQPERSNTHGTNFLTPPEFALQVGYLQYRSGESIRAHTHPSIHRAVSGTAEIAIVQSGLCEVELFTDDGSPLSTHTLKAGEALLMLFGGHSFRMLEDTVLYLIKQGPYNGPEDKIEIT